MDYLNLVLKNNYPDWMIKESDKKPATLFINPDTGLEIMKNVFIFVPCVTGCSKEFRRIFQHTIVQIMFKGANTLKYIFMHPKDIIPSQLKQNIVYKWFCPEENCNLSYLGESSRCLEKRVKEHNSHVTRAIYKHSISNNHPSANISHFKIIYQDKNQVAREDREAIHIRINNLALNHNTGKMYQ